MHQKHQTFLFIIITLFLGSCNNAPQETIVETNTDSTATKIDTTTKVVEQPTIPALKAPPEGSCLGWNLVEEAEDVVLLESDCLPVNGVYHLWDTSTTHNKSLSALLTGLDFYQYFSNGGDKEITGKIIAYYQNGRKMVELDLEKGNRSGLYIASNEKGKVQVYRDYSGAKVKSRKELYNSKWTIDTHTVELDIDINDYEEINGQKVYSFVILDYNQVDYFITKSIWDKSPLKVNGKPFTGTLRGYSSHVEYNYNNKHFEAFKIFEIELKNGRLHGHFNLWTEYFGHMLEELFENGELKETIYKLDTEEMDGVAKPVIYLYPEKEQAINVKLNLKGKIVHPYPRYNAQEGWNVIAKPNGDIKDPKTGKDYYCLYWEGLTPHQFDLSTGFVVKGSQSIEFLEQKLEQLGLNRREANEMIIYWLPRLEKNPYNLIHFSTKEYTRLAALNITPKPDHLIRVMMVFKALEQPIAIKEQKLSNYSQGRKGFTVVEWGGQEITKKSIHHPLN